MSTFQQFDFKTAKSGFFFEFWSVCGPFIKKFTQEKQKHIESTAPRLEERLKNLLINSCSLNLNASE